MLPLIAGLTGDSFYEESSMTDGFQVAMIACAILAALGGVLAWLTISSEVLHEEPEPGEPRHEEFSCGVTAPPLRPAQEHDFEPVPDEPAAVPAGGVDLGG